MAILIHCGEWGGAVSRCLFPLVTCLALAVSLSVAADAAARPADSIELQVRAAFLYNFAKFVEWPSDVSPAGSSGSLAFCVFGDEPLLSALTQSLVGKTINGRALVARRSEGPEGARQCDIAFIGAGEKKRMDELLDGFAGAGVLSISDLDQFARRGGMIELARKADKFRFAVNIDAMTRQGLRISSKLLQLAEVLHRPTNRAESREAPSGAS